MGEDDEVVPPDMPEERIGSPFGGVPQDPGERLDRLVPPEEAVVVVVGLELVEVDVEEGHLFPRGDAERTCSKRRRTRFTRETSSTGSNGLTMKSSAPAASPMLRSAGRERPVSRMTLGSPNRQSERSRRH